MLDLSVTIVHKITRNWIKPCHVLYWMKTSWVWASVITRELHYIPNLPNCLPILAWHTPNNHFVRYKINSSFLLACMNVIWCTLNFGLCKAWIWFCSLSTRRKNRVCKHHRLCIYATNYVHCITYMHALRFTVIWSSSLSLMNLTITSITEWFLDSVVRDMVHSHITYSGSSMIQ